MSLAFLACVEAGPLEAQAALLFRSIRRNAGRFRDAPILAFQPREGPALESATLSLMRELRVEHRTEILNRDFAHYPVANKVFASAWAEEHLEADVVVFLDSDTFFCGEPDELLLPGGEAAGVRPVNKVNIGSEGDADPKDRYWQKVYRLCGVEPPPFVETSVDRRRIRGYWNAGLIAFRRQAGLAARWRRHFLTLMAAGQHPYNGLKNMDQVALAAALADPSEGIRALDPRYNYPLPKRSELSEPLRTAELEELVHVHYFRWFNTPGFLDSLTPGFSDASPLRAWLAEQLPLHPIREDAARKTAHTAR